MSQPGQYPNQNNYPQQPPPPYNQGPPPGYPPRQPGGYPQQQPGGYPPQQYQGAPYAAAPVKKPANPLLYLLPLVGVVIMVVGVFLPWLTLNIGTSTLTINGMGSVGGTSNLASDAAGSGAKDGVLVLSLAGILIVLIVLGMLLKMRGFAIAAIVFGVFSVALMVFEVANISQSIKDLAVLANTTQTGIGVYVGLVGSIIVLLGAIITVAFFRRSKAAA